MIANYHTHTIRCRHASGSEREYIETAISRGVKLLGFSDHSPQLFPAGYYSNYRMFPEETENYFETIRSLADEYRSDITILVGLETEYFPELFDSLIEFLTPYSPDYLILGQHYIDNEYDTRRYSGNPNSDESALKRYVDQTLEALGTKKFSCFAHPDLINYTKSSSIWEREMRRLCEGAKRLDVPLEINLLGLSENRHYPRADFWRIAKETGNEVILGCDAHQPERVAVPGELEKAKAFVDAIGLETLETLKLIPPCE